MIKIHEQISFLRKQRGLTQEGLAKHLGVTNQTVSKWEAGQCCPDIQLLPAIASFFHVSVDALLGYQPADTTEDLVLALRSRIESLPHGEDAAFACRVAYAIHAIYLSKGMSPVNPGWNTENAIENAGMGAWGYSAVNVPEITTIMRQSSVFFSNNQNLRLTNRALRHIASVTRAFSNVNSLRTASALYQLTVHDENAYATVAQICEKTELSEETVKACLLGELSDFLLERSSSETEFRFDGACMDLIPVLTLLDNQG